MKTNKRLITKVVSVVLLLTLTGVFTQCVATNTEQVGNGSNQNNSNSGNETPLDDGQIINTTEISEGIKSHEQIFYTMSVLTGVPVTNGNVKGVYNQVATTLPTDNDLKVFLPPHQLAITKLAAEFCQVLVEDANLRVVVWPKYRGFTANPATGLSQANRILIVQEVVDAFWGGVLSEADLADAESELQLLIGDLLASENLNTAVTTRSVVKGVCTVALSSAHVTLL